MASATQHPLTIRNEFHSIVDGSTFKLDPSADSETDLYKADGESRTIAQLCELMITQSSNLATNLLLYPLLPLLIHWLGLHGAGLHALLQNVIATGMLILFFARDARDQPEQS